jgi:hypothetical protein
MFQNIYPSFKHVKKRLGKFLFTVCKQISLYQNEAWWGLRYGYFLLFGISEHS